MPDAVLATEAPADRYRWTIGLLLGVGVLVNYFDRVNLSVSHAALVHDFGISAGTFGQLSAAYSWTYAMCQVPTGVLLDRFGVRRISLASIAVWAVASLAAAVSPGVLLFFAARLLLGVGEAPTFPANAKAVGAWFPLSERVAGYGHLRQCGKVRKRGRCAAARPAAAAGGLAHVVRVYGRSFTGLHAAVCAAVP